MRGLFCVSELLTRAAVSFANRRVRKSLLMRLTSVLVTTALITNASASVLGSFIAWVHLPQLQVQRASMYSDAPSNTYLGPNPGKDEVHRGGMFTDAMLQSMGIGASAEFGEQSGAAHGPSLLPSARLLIPLVNQYTGEPYKWEGRQNLQAGDLNTVNGDKITQIGLFSWKQRG